MQTSSVAILRPGSLDERRHVLALVVERVGRGAERHLVALGAWARGGRWWRHQQLFQGGRRGRTLPQGGHDRRRWRQGAAHGHQTIAHRGQIHQQVLKSFDLFFIMRVRRKRAISGCSNKSPVGIFLARRFCWYFPFCSRCIIHDGKFHAHTRAR